MKGHKELTNSIKEALEFKLSASTVNKIAEDLARRLIAEGWRKGEIKV